MKHDVMMLDLGDFPNAAVPDEFFEFLCLDSKAIHRVAVNRALRQVAVIYNDSAPRVYL